MPDKMTDETQSAKTKPRPWWELYRDSPGLTDEDLAAHEPSWTEFVEDARRFNDIAREAGGAAGFLELKEVLEGMPSEDDRLAFIRSIAHDERFVGEALIDAYHEIESVFGPVFSEAFAREIVRDRLDRARLQRLPQQHAIASLPTVIALGSGIDASRLEEARAIAEQERLTLPPNLEAHLEQHGFMELEDRPGASCGGACHSTMTPTQDEARAIQTTRQCLADVRSAMRDIVRGDEDLNDDATARVWLRLIDAEEALDSIENQAVLDVWIRRVCLVHELARSCCG